MPKVIRQAIDFSQGHCYPPLPCLTGSLTVFANSFPIVRQGDNYNQQHTCVPLVDTHNMGQAVGGSPNVFIEGMPVHRDADLISCGDVADNGSDNVFANDGGIPGGSTGSNGNTVGYTVGIPVLTYPYYDIVFYRSLINPCDKFYENGVKSGGIVGTFPGNLYSPLTEEDTGNISKDYTVPITNVTITPDLPSFLSFNAQTGDLILIGDIPYIVPITTYTIEYENFVGRNRTIITLGVINVPEFTFTCQ